MELIQDRFFKLQSAMNLDLNEKIKALQKSGRKIHHLGFGQSPFPVPHFAQEALKSSAAEAEYLPVKGLQSTREAICEYHSRIDGLTHFSPDDVIIGPGSKELIFLLMNVLRGDIFLLAPTWTTYRPQATIAGKTARILETSASQGWKLTPDLLAAAAASAPPGSVLIFCNPDNPTGAIYNKAELKALADAIRGTNMIVLCDEIYARLKYDGDHHSLVTYLPDQTILSSGISKWASCGGWRLGYHMYPTSLRPVLTAVQAVASNSYTCCSTPIQHASQALLKFDAKAAEYTRHSARILGAVGNYCADTLSKAGVAVTTPHAGYYIFPDFEPFRRAMEVKGIKTGEQMCAAMLEEANVSLLAGGPAFLHDTSRFTVRLCFINFDGAHAMKASVALGLSKPLPQDFVEKQCSETVDAIRCIVHWLEKLVQNGH